MAKKIMTVDEIRIDIVEALKRAFIKQGYVPRPRRSEQTPVNRLSISGSDQEVEVVAPEQPQEAHEKLIDVTEKAQDCLFKADTVFPFTLFPDTITLDREKLTVATRHFFKMATIVSVPISSISSAEVDVGPFFGSLHMASKFFTQNKYTVNWLSREKALKLQHLMQGFIIAQDKKIDVTDINKEDLLILLDDLGQGVSD